MKFSFIYNTFCMFFYYTYSIFIYFPSGAKPRTKSRVKILIFMSPAQLTNIKHLTKANNLNKFFINFY